MDLFRGIENWMDIFLKVLVLWKIVKIWKNDFMKLQQLFN